MRRDEKGARRIPGIKWKLFGYLIGFCLLLLVILALFQTVFLNRFYVAIKQRQVNQAVERIALYVSDADWDGLSAAYEAQGSDIFIDVWSPDTGRKLTQGQLYDPGDGLPAPQEFGQLYGELQRDGPMTRQHRSGGKRDNMPFEILTTARLVDAADGNSYIVYVSAVLTPVAATVDTLRVQLYFISALMLVLAVALALLISRKISRPIVGISRTAGELTRGNYHVVFRGTGYQEVVRLAEVLTEAAEGLRRTEQLQRELIANVSHDLRTPLTMIAGYSEMIRDIPGEATPENMQVIIDEARRLTTLVGDLLDLSRLQAGIEKLSLAPFDLQALSAEIAGRVSHLSAQDGVTIALDIQPGPLPVSGDRARMAQVIYNFLLNGVAHAGEDAIVTLRLRAEGAVTRLEVSDTGEGIPPEQLQSIWERYYKLDAVHSRAGGGSGLGLSIVRSILSQHPGVEYGVSSEVGRGTTFWFTIETCLETTDEGEQQPYATNPYNAAP